MLPHLHVVDTRVGAYEAILEPSYEIISTLESEVASKHAYIPATVRKLTAQRAVKLTEQGTSLMSVTICNHELQLHAAEAARSNAEVAIRLVKSQLHDFSVSE